MEALSVATAEWFRKPETQAVFACLNREGFEARAVGGAVRNALIGRAVTEVDFATTAKPEEVVRLAAASGIKSVPTGITHGTVMLVVNGTGFEVTTLRRDVATDGRRAIVAFGGDWAEDARRRDFTINALYADASGKVHDPLGEGINDIEARRVRFIGSPDERIREDYLRILRFFRFSAEYAEGEFDRQAIVACIRNREGLSRLSRERVRAEFLKLLIASRAREAIAIMDEIGLLQRVLGGVALRGRFERLCDLEASLGFPPDPIFRLAALSIFVEEDAPRLAERLRLSGKEAADLLALSARNPALSGSMDRGDLLAALYRLGARIYLGRLLLAWAAEGASSEDAGWRHAASLAKGWARPRFPLSGGDLVALGWKPGPALGEKLKELEDLWIRQEFKSAREDLLARARPS
jgi:tRNA nucleotidyltransferase/poly(A) polymerase